MRRGDIVTIAAPGDYGKPRPAGYGGTCRRPAVVIQSDYFNDTHASVLLCPFTSDLFDAPLFRLAVAPTKENGLKVNSQIVVDKIITMRREKVGKRIGRLDEKNTIQLNRSLALFIGLA